MSSSKTWRERPGSSSGNAVYKPNVRSVQNTTQSPVIDDWNKTHSKSGTVSLISRGNPTNLKNRSEQIKLFDSLIARPEEFDKEALLFSYRGLREGIVASGTFDDFAVKIYESSVDAAIKYIAVAEARPELIRSLNFLTSTCYAEASANKYEPPNRARFTSYFILHVIATEVVSSNTAWDSEFWKLSQLIHSLPNDVVSAKEMQLAMTIWKSIRFDVDYLSLSRAVAHASASHMVFIQEMMGPLRKRIVQILKKGYYKLDKDIVSSYLMFGDDDDLLLSQVLHESGIVIDEKNATTGLAFASFAILHMGGHALAHFNIDLANHALQTSQKYYRIPAIEIGAVFGSLAVHAVSSIARWWIRKPAVKSNNTPYAVKERNWHQTLGWILLPMVALHANSSRLEPISILGKEAADKISDYSIVGIAGVALPPFTVYFSIMMAAGLIHTAYGTGYALQTLGIKMPTAPKISREAWFYGLSALGVSSSLAVCGWYYTMTFTPAQIHMAAKLHEHQGFFQDAIAKTFGAQYSLKH
ncbi:hypothetical protein SmJEL517_g02245 [Synchytrium microbalum]|uniref:SAC3/GANP/THP3 conserved domain-containing protein n=1 Tax=Synchytrium microbalum TaxID=1806994 RepID=A0A507CCR7_9FUNG|nr:uncharacterized protein SmJEL517_g02245 [Synchytrium microbalum]TPX35333.1 hypothetical protein SmJEL517_g02245 [Synchytrium microbalum]